MDFLDENTRQQNPITSRLSYLAFLMGGVFAAPFTKFLEFNLAFYRLLVLADIIIPPLANAALQTD